MYKFTDVTYPLLVATQADYSLFYATGLVTFKFEFIDPKSRLFSRSIFHFTALYRYSDRTAPLERLSFTSSKNPVDAVVSSGRMSLVYPRRDRDKTFASDPYAFVVGVGLREHASSGERLKMHASVRRLSRINSRFVLKVKAACLNRSSAAVSDYFKLGRGSTWRDASFSHGHARIVGFVRIVDGALPSEYLKVKGERQREDDVVGSFDAFDVRLTTRPVQRTVTADSFFVKNPHSRSFLLGDSSPENTALGGQGYV